MSDDTTIAEGKAAWQRIKERSKSTFSDWIEVGRMLIAGRSLCMKQANCNSPYGPAYHRFIREWLLANDLQEIDSHERRGSIVMVENLVEIEGWRATLSAVEIRRCNHPNSVLAHWRRKTRPMRSGPKTYVHTAKATNVRRNGRPIKFDQQMIKRAGAAMRQSWSNDVYSLATIALQAAIRDERDILELLPDPPKPAPRQSGAPVALELS